MNLEIKSTTLMGPGGPLREEEITAIPSQDQTQHVVIQQMLRKIKQIRKIHRAEEVEGSTTKTEMEVARSNLKERAMIKRLEVTKRYLDSPVECAQRPLTQTY